MQGDTAEGWAPVGPQLRLPHIKFIYPTGEGWFATNSTAVLLQMPPLLLLQQALQ